jgi:hypothetical protein
MAKILTFEPTEFDRTKSADESRAVTSAEVIVFPGIRYERWDESRGEEPDATSTEESRTRGRRRDVLNLAE